MASSSRKILLKKTVNLETILIDSSYLVYAILFKNFFLKTVYLRNFFLTSSSYLVCREGDFSIGDGGQDEDEKRTKDLHFDLKCCHKRSIGRSTAAVLSTNVLCFYIGCLPYDGTQTLEGRCGRLYICRNLKG